MKKSFLIIAIIMLVAALICFFPFTRSISIEGKGDILNLEKEKIGDCELRVEIKESRSLLVFYNRKINFSIDNKDYMEFESSHDNTLNGVSLVTQMFYSAEKDRMEGVSLIYPWNYSFAVLRLDDMVYCTGIAPEELPVSFSAEE